MIRKFRILACALCACFMITGCPRPYVENPEILGDKPALLMINKKTFENTALSQITLYQRAPVCKGVGNAKVKTEELGSMFIVSNVMLEKALIPADTPIAVFATYAQKVSYDSSEVCHTLVHFKPKRSAKYFYSTVFRGGTKDHPGKCGAEIVELASNNKINKVELLDRYTVFGAGWQDVPDLFCDDKGRLLTPKQWEQFKARSKKPE
jgi:hypothetical protein